jgi:hypothetical protein
MADNPHDYTDKFNTKLTPAEERQFQAWAVKAGRQNDLYDYDMRGAWKDGIGSNEDGHFPDTFKKPNHPTFSDQSIYNGVDGNVGGSWDKDEENRDTFQPSETNLRHLSPNELKSYFSTVEPDSVLLLPQE